jgi:hypothetical protein
VEYYLTKKNKDHTWYTTRVSVLGDEIWQSPFSTYAAQRESYAPQSFAVNRQGSEHGVDSAIAGRTAYVVMQARDRFGNWQQEGGDPFNATFTDSLGQYNEMAADDYRVCPNNTDTDDSNSDSSDSDGGVRRRTLLQEMLQATTVRQRHSLATEWNSMAPAWRSATAALQTSAGRTLLGTHGGGRSLLQFGTAFPAPDLDFRYADAGVYNLNYTVYVRGWAVMTLTLEPCVGPPALHLGAYDVMLPSSPFLIYVSSSETYPGTTRWFSCALIFMGSLP